MKIAVVFGWLHESDPVTTIIYPERLQPFVRDAVYFWEREEEERIEEIRIREELPPDSFLEAEHRFWECHIKAFGRKGEMKPRITRSLIEKAIGEERMTRVLWTMDPFNDTDFLAAIIWRAFNVYWVEATRRSQETLEFFPITFEKHLEEGR